MNGLLRKRCTDEKATVRKAALLLITKVTSPLGGSIDKFILKTMGMSCLDPLVSIRKAAITALSENRYNDMGNLVQGKNVLAAPAPFPEFNITQGRVTLDLSIHNDPQHELQTTCILIAARIEEQYYFR
ncbi:hypothetical protein Q3G72_022021 [Acer saccharum]|nr:hypothetical protein Q3G72_022021 [Acer saccharum]